MDQDTYVVRPQNEPWGTGRGWDTCRDQEATRWSVYAADGLGGAYCCGHTTHREAETYMSSRIVRRQC